MTAPKKTKAEIKKLGKDVREVILSQEAKKKTATEQRNEAAEKKSRDLEAMTLRVWALKRNGYSNAAIAKAVGISESTVRARLNQPLAPEELLRQNMLEALSDAQEKITESVVDHWAFSQLFGEEILRLSTRRSEVTVGNKRLDFALEFSIEVKDD